MQSNYAVSNTYKYSFSKSFNSPPKIALAISQISTNVPISAIMSSLYITAQNKSSFGF